MLSYLHGFHAGNHADVLKHLVLVHLLDHLNRKPGAWAYVDTHAGAGLYDLGDERAQKKAEFADGIGRVRTEADPPAAVARLLEVIAGFQSAPGVLDRYPGSPLIARTLARDGDALHLFELHPGEHEALRSAVAGRRGTHVLREDGFRSALGRLPPPARRGLVLVDPPYEVKTDYDAVVRFLGAAHRRFATGTVAIWYPVVDRARIDRLCDALRACGVPDLLRAELRVAADTEAHGMTGSGLVVLHPAWTLEAALRESLPWLAERLARGAGAGWTIERLAPE